MRAFGFISCGFEEGVAFLIRAEVANLAGSFPKLVTGSGSGLADQGLELGKWHLDGIEVWTAGRQEQEPCADVFQDRGGLRAAVGGKGIQNHHVALVQGRGQLGFDMKVKKFPVDRPVNDPRARPACRGARRR